MTKRGWREDSNVERHEPPFKRTKTSTMYKIGTKLTSVFYQRTKSIEIQTDNTLTDFNPSNSNHYHSSCTVITPQSQTIATPHGNMVDICSIIRNNPKWNVQITVGTSLKCYKTSDLQNIPWFVDKTMNNINTNANHVSHVDILNRFRKIEIVFENVDWNIKHFDVLVQLSKIDRQDLNKYKYFSPTTNLGTSEFSQSMLEPLAQCDEYFASKNLDKRIISLSAMEALVRTVVHFDKSFDRRTLVDNTTNHRLKFAACKYDKRFTHRQLAQNIGQIAFNLNATNFYEWLGDGVCLCFVKQNTTIKKKKHRKQKQYNLIKKPDLNGREFVGLPYDKKTRSIQTGCDLYWDRVTNDRTSHPHDGHTNRQENRKIRIIVNNTSDYFDVNDLKLIGYFTTLWSKRWNGKIKNTIKIDGINLWNVNHLKFLILCIKNNNSIPYNLPFNVSFLLSLIECDLYLSSKPIINKKKLLNYFYTCENGFDFQIEYKTFWNNENKKKTQYNKMKKKLFESSNVKMDEFVPCLLKSVMNEWENIKQTFYDKELIWRHGRHSCGTSGTIKSSPMFACIDIIEFAQNGIEIIKNVFTNVGRRMMSVFEFIQRCPFHFPL